MHVYQHPHQVGRFAITREVDGENWLFFERIEKPESISLIEMQEHIGNAQDRPAAEVPLFQLQQFFSGLPKFVRRLVWWATMNLSGSVRAGMVGTYALTTVAPFEATSVHPPSLGSMLFTYGPLQADGSIRLTFVYDHRLFDGATIAGYLAEFETALTEVVYEELKGLQSAGELTAAA